MDTTKLRKRMPVATLLDPKIVGPAIGQAFVKLNPATLIKNPVIFVLEIVTALTTVLLVRDLVHRGHRLHLPDRPLAVVHRAVRQFRRSGGGRPRQGASGYLAPQPRRDEGQEAFGSQKSVTALRRSRRWICGPEILSSSKPVTSSPATAMWSKASLRSTRRR